MITSKDTTTFIDGAGDEQAIKARMELVRVQLKNTTLDFDREKLRERLTKLSGGVAVLKVGTATESDLKEKKHRVEDTRATTRAAVEEGIVPGGGVALINAISALSAVQASNDDERFGVQILRCALEEPLRILARNAGEDGTVVLAAVRRAQQEQGDAGYGYNVLTPIRASDCLSYCHWLSRRSSHRPRRRFPTRPHHRPLCSAGTFAA